ncbi:hypothetical protein A0H81_01421 [Grifola frondosa]|uniref:Uncharacterized protein n=1 Tax=Grifola frondosa TaxID=5627 RepID=A0A1C7MQJ5_GRIFR|nr:hypothetical protein A0H81_01421 [Grifola frondosa]
MYDMQPKMRYQACLNKTAIDPPSIQARLQSTLCPLLQRQRPRTIPRRPSSNSELWMNVATASTLRIKLAEVRFECSGPAARQGSGILMKLNQ